VVTDHFAFLRSRYPGAIEIIDCLHWFLKDNEVGVEFPYDLVFACSSAETYMDYVHLTLCMEHLIQVGVIHRHWEVNHGGIKIGEFASMMDVPNDWTDASGYKRPVLPQDISTICRMLEVVT
jgi:hypothetical protein